MAQNLCNNGALAELLTKCDIRLLVGYIRLLEKHID